LLDKGHLVAVNQCPCLFLLCRPQLINQNAIQDAVISLPWSFTAAIGSASFTRSARLVCGNLSEVCEVANDDSRAAETN
jgi:hypothetical protein